jgi:hypothetical protein
MRLGSRLRSGLLGSSQISANLFLRVLRTELQRVSTSILDHTLLTEVVAGLAEATSLDQSSTRQSNPSGTGRTKVMRVHTHTRTFLANSVSGLALLERTGMSCSIESLTNGRLLGCLGSNHITVSRCPFAKLANGSLLTLLLVHRRLFHRVFPCLEEMVVKTQGLGFLRHLRFRVRTRFGMRSL